MKHPLPELPWPSAAEAAASRLFSSIPIGPIEASSRTWVPAMVPWRSNAEGLVTEEVLDWYGRFAEGQPGVIVVEATGIRDVPSGPLLRIGSDRFLPGLRRLVEVVRERSGGQTRLFIQIIDFLRIRRRPDKQRFIQQFLPLTDRHRERVTEVGSLALSDDAVRAALLELPDSELLAALEPREAEALEFGARERVTDTHLTHIAELPRVLPGLFAEAARRAQTAGFDGVELHYAHAYTMASFLSALNDRGDGYGGHREGRVRLPMEVLAAVREQVGPEFPIGCRMLGDEVIDGGTGPGDAAWFAGRLAAAGMDFISVSKGGKFEDAKQPKVGATAYPYTGVSGHECMPTVRIDGAGPFGRNLPLSRQLREAVRASGHPVPVIGCGGIGTFVEAEAALEHGDCDIVAAARQSLADPDWWRKMRLGRGAETRRCLYTNYCEALDQRHKEVTCQLWDRRAVEAGNPDPMESPSGGRPRSLDGKRWLLPPSWR